jgi:hypothetical protein
MHDDTPWRERLYEEETAVFKRERDRLLDTVRDALDRAWAAGYDARVRELLKCEREDARPRRAFVKARAFLKARVFLLKILGEGPRRATEVQAEARLAGISDATLRRARESICRSRQTGDDGWWWELHEVTP